jgi:hypothetical protein
MSLIKFVDNFNLYNLHSKPRYHVWKAFSISKNTATVDMLLLKFKVTLSVSLIHCSVVLWRARKPNWLALSRSLISVCLWTMFSMTFSKSLPIMDKRLIGRKFWVFISHSCQSQSHITTDDQSVSASWFRALSGAHDQMLITVWQLLFCRYRAPPLMRGGSVICLSHLNCFSSVQ